MGFKCIACFLRAARVVGLTTLNGTVISLLLLCLALAFAQMFNDIGTKDNRFGMLVTDPTTGRPCKYGAVMEVRCVCAGV